MGTRVNPDALNRKARWLYNRMAESREGIEHHDLIGKAIRQGREPGRTTEHIPGLGRMLLVPSRPVPIVFEK